MTDQHLPGVRLDGPALISAAEAEDLPVTKWALPRLRRQGLLPPPVRTGQDGRSPRWTYPPGTDAQLVALLRWRQQTKDADVLRVALWLQGFAIPEADVRAALGRRLRALQQGWEQALRAYAQRHGLDLGSEPGRREALQGIARTLAGQRSKAVIPRYSRMRAAERTHGLALLMEIFGLGEPDARDAAAAEADGQVLERMLGIAPNGRRAHLGGEGPWLTGPPEAMFDAATVTSYRRLQQVADDVTDDELATVRPLAATFLQQLPYLVRFADAFTGTTNTLGMAAVLEMTKSPEPVVFMVPMFVSMLRTDEAWRESLFTIVQALEGVEDIKTFIEQLLQTGSKVMAKNLAAMPAGQRQQIQRIIDAATDGALETAPHTRTVR